MAASAVEAIKNEINRKQAEIDALTMALAALGGAAPVKQGRAKGNRRARTDAEKKALSKAMKAAWRRRKSATAGPAKKTSKAAAKKKTAKKTSEKSAASPSA